MIQTDQFYSRRIKMLKQSIFIEKVEFVFKTFHQTKTNKKAPQAQMASQVTSKHFKKKTYHNP